MKHFYKHATQTDSILVLFGQNSVDIWFSRSTEHWIICTKMYTVDLLIRCLFSAFYFIDFITMYAEFPGKGISTTITAIVLPREWWYWTPAFESQQPKQGNFIK